MTAVPACIALDPSLDLDYQYSINVVSQAHSCASLIPLQQHTGARDADTIAWSSAAHQTHIYAGILTALLQRT